MRAQLSFTLRPEEELSVPGIPNSDHSQHKARGTSALHASWVVLWPFAYSIPFACFFCRVKAIRLWIQLPSTLYYNIEARLVIGPDAIGKNNRKTGY